MEATKGSVFFPVWDYNNPNKKIKDCNQAVLCYFA